MKAKRKNPASPKQKLEIDMMKEKPINAKRNLRDRGDNQSRQRQPKKNELGWEQPKKVDKIVLPTKLWKGERGDNQNQRKNKITSQ